MKNIDTLVRDREVLTVEQAAEYLQIHKVTVYKYIRAGILPAAKLGKVYRIYRRDLEALMAAARASGK
ncbi:MAG TPA: helix-turn-helix domain-containing protein [bacterium]|nr:helix-turn-helix domain-containing protein [bacterium]